MRYQKIIKTIVCLLNLGLGLLATKAYSETTDETSIIRENPPAAPIVLATAPIELASITDNVKQKDIANYPNSINLSVTDLTSLTPTTYQEQTSQPLLARGNEKKPPTASRIEPLSVRHAIQKKGESYEKVLKTLKLTAAQIQIVKSADFNKSTPSDRHFFVYFEQGRVQPLLRGLRLQRQGAEAIYFLKRQQNNSPRLISVQQFDSTMQQAIREALAKADHKAGYKTTSSKQPSTPNNAASSASNTRDTSHDSLQASNKRPSNSNQPVAPATTTNSDSNKENKSSKDDQTHLHSQFFVLRLIQHKGEQIERVVKNAKLTSLQRQLVVNLPIMPDAESLRKIDLLFERDGNNQYLRAANATRDNKSIAFVLTQYKGKLEWANKNGQVSRRTTFLRTPVNGPVTSGFNLRRRHPITKKIRPHYGVDFGVPYGTPIWAPSHGRVSFVGRKRGYGMLLDIDHGNGYVTRYAHLSRVAKGLHVGSVVSQRQVIAYVGSSGLSSGAHLHYEVIVNGVRHDPMKVKLPGGEILETLSKAKTDAAHYLPILRKLQQD